MSGRPMKMRALEAVVGTRGAVPWLQARSSTAATRIPRRLIIRPAILPADPRLRSAGPRTSGPVHRARRRLERPAAQRDLDHASHPRRVQRDLLLAGIGAACRRELVDVLVP